MQAIVIDATILNTVQSCGLKAYYAFHKNLKPLETPTYFDKGSLMHELTRLYRVFRRHRPNWSKQKMLEICIKKGRKFYIKLDLSVGDCEEILSYFVAYADKYHGDGWQFLTIEKPFFKELYRNDSLVIFYQGKPDCSARVPKFDPLIVSDMKTGSRDTEPSILSNQFIGYAWALDTQIVVVDKVNFYKKMDNEKSFKRYILNYPQDLIEEWKEGAIYWALTYKGYIESEYYPPNLTSCDKYGGCVFAKTSMGKPGICETERAARNSKILSEYKVGEPWDVGKTLKT